MNDSITIAHETPRRRRVIIPERKPAPLGLRLKRTVASSKPQQCRECGRYFPGTGRRPMILRDDICVLCAGYW